MAGTVNNTGVVQQNQTNKPASSDAGFISDATGATTGSSGSGVTVTIGSGASAFTTGLTGSAVNNGTTGMANTTTEADVKSGSGGVSINNNSADILTGNDATAASTNHATVNTSSDKASSSAIAGDAKQVKNADGTDMKGVFYKKTADGKCELVIKKEAGDVNVDQNLLKRIMGDNYDSNKVTVKLDQDNLKTSDKVGKVNITTDVGNITVDNDNDYKEVGGDTNIAKADLTVSGQKDKLILIQDVDVNTEGWNLKGDNKNQNIGSDLKYNISGCDVDISGHVTNKFSTDDIGAQGLMAGNKIDVNAIGVGKIKDTTTMTNDFQVGTKIEQTEISQTVLNFLKEKGLDAKNIIYKDAKALGITDGDVNHFSKGAHGGTGLIVMKMGNGAWVVSGSGSPNTYTFTKKALENNDPNLSASSKSYISDPPPPPPPPPPKSDPFNKVNYNTGVFKSEGADGKSNQSDAVAIKPTIVDISGLRQQAKGAVYGVDGYVIKNSVNSDAGVQLEGSAAQTIDVTGINYALTADSGNFINGTANTDTGKVKEEHLEKFVGISDDLEMLMAESLGKNMLDDKKEKEENAAVTTTTKDKTTAKDAVTSNDTTADGADPATTVAGTTAAGTATGADGTANANPTAATTADAGTTKGTTKAAT